MTIGSEMVQKQQLLLVLICICFDNFTTGNAILYFLESTIDSHAMIPLPLRHMILIPEKTYHAAGRLIMICQRCSTSIFRLGSCREEHDCQRKHIALDHSESCNAPQGVLHPQDFPLRLGRSGSESAMRNIKGN